MRILRLFCLLFFLSVPVFAVSDYFDVVFDLDWTLAYKTTAEQAAKDPSGIFQFENEYYRLSPGTIVALRKLHTTPGIRVSFNSGGTPQRNVALLEFIYSQINANSLNATYEPHMVLDKQDLVANPDALPTDPFAVRFKKTLLSINPDLKKIILIDDIKNFLLHGQEANMLWTGTTFEDLLSYAEAVQKMGLAKPEDRKYFPNNEVEYLKERNKILRLVDLVLKAFQQSPADPVSVLNLWTHDRLKNSLDLTRGGLRCEALF